MTKTLFLTYFRDWAQIGEPSAWQLLWGVLTLAAGGGSLSWLWLQLDHIAARMSMPIAVLILLLLAEIRPRRSRRHRRRSAALPTTSRPLAVARAPIRTCRGRVGEPPCARGTLVFYLEGAR